MSQLRSPSVAGLFYPDDATQLAHQIRGYLDAAAPDISPTQQPTSQSAQQSRSFAARCPKALIVPHAGYIYSGAVAAHAYSRIAGHARQITRVILLGPAHRFAFKGLAYCSAQRYLTPLGEIPVDRTALDIIAKLDQVQELDTAFNGEHCLEVQLPFLQMVLSNFSILPLLVGNLCETDIAEALDQVWGGRETLIVISSDLSHYLDYQSAQRIDRQTSEAICQLCPEAINSHQACGRQAIAGLLLEARRHELRAELLDLRNSGDTAGMHERVVGYGAYAFA
ncbi:MAG TPA: AmmeMemoRadiSam system protein B [Chromatiaceae bacterium]|jgi:AmmeMemoRadiSam system protein B|nr:MAG: hypothetical protein N838_22335 [Thiohalocapsa sp. PB-PSB1]QQO56360.1 MAG: AmmeMemoRadiSam system protein B [Thiohalocapsa sp. PB-PSB1]HBG94869.1 AmmeMemoRadiSam system protein B [Chromatiaceae bacterium]HCS88600.1 AmmeMemoRadiSam system protein B [Chromatiaceae bacterium]